MAKTGGRDFKKGNPGGPGRPRLPPDIKGARAMNQLELERSINKMLFMTAEELQTLARDPDTALLDRMLASICIKGVKEGSHAHLDFILNRTIGKVSEKVQHQIRRPFTMRILEDDGVVGGKIVLGHRPEEEED